MNPVPKLSRAAVFLIASVAFLISGAFAQTLEFDYNFRNGALGWTGDFASYPPWTNTSGFYQLESGIRFGPRKLTRVPTRTFYIQGANHSASLIMFLKRRLTAADGIVAGRTYRAEFIVTAASNAATGCVGIGAPPGEGVYLRAGTTNVEPVPVLQHNGDLELNVDFETTTAEAGNIANGLDCESAYPHFPFVSIQRPAEYATVTASQNGELWLLVGTRSGYEGFTPLYYQRIKVRLIPV